MDFVRYRYPHHHSKKLTQPFGMSQSNRLQPNGRLSVDVPSISGPNSPLSPNERSNRKRTRSEAALDDIALNTVWKATPLDGGKKIRILELHGGDGSDLEANLEIHNPKIPYEALSYTWGSKEKESKIRIVKNSKIYNVAITSNLASALRQLRYKKEDMSRWLWIDALCINQEDHIEKNHQVPKMASIYNEASNVCVWLGDGDPRNDKRHKDSRRGEESDRKDEDNNKIARGLIKRVLNLDSFERLIGDERSTKDWNALLALMKRPWFSRRWVVQEIALARKATVYFGEFEVQWKELANAVALFGSRHQQISSLFQESSAFNHQADYLGDVTALAAYQLVQQSSNLFRKSDDGQIQEHLLSLETLVSLLSSFEARYAHDTVYAVLSLAEDTGSRFSVRPAANPTTEAEEATQDPVPLSADDETRARPAIERFKRSVEAFPVDYKKSFFEVCKDFLRFTIKHSESLDIICRPWAPTKSDEKLPSWIPTLLGTAFRPGNNLVHSRVNADSLVGLPTHGKGNYNAARKFRLTSTSNFRIGDDAEGGSLFVDGFVLDTISEKALPATQGNVPVEWLELGGWENTSHAPPDAFWRTLIADRDSGGKNPPLYYELACQQAFAQRAPGDDLNTHKLILANSRSKAMSQKVVIEYLQRLQAIVWKRSLITTTHKSLLGLVPHKAKEGDKICILRGCSVPVLLREIPGQTKGVRHELIGECYIHGMMDGEGFRVMQNEHLPIVIFELQ